MRTSDKKDTGQNENDSWSFDNASRENHSEMLEDKEIDDHLRNAPVAAGYEGYRGVVAKFKSTALLPRLQSPSDDGDSRETPGDFGKESVDPREPLPKPPASVYVTLAPEEMDKRSHPSNSTTTPKIKSPSRDLLVAALVLMLDWLVPNVWSNQLLFPVHALQLSNTFSGALALLATPAAGAIVLVLLYLPLAIGPRLIGMCLAGFASLALPVLLGEGGLPVDGRAILLATTIATISAIIAFSVLTSRKIGYLALLLIPLALLIMVVLGAVEQFYPASRIEIFKTPVKLFASMTIIAVSTSSLLAEWGRYRGK